MSLTFKPGPGIDPRRFVITDPSAYARTSNAELCQEAARRLCNQGMKLYGNEVAQMKRGTLAGHLITVAIFGAIGVALALAGLHVGAG